MTNSTVWRILDASANRASEGLRTIEEYTRFVLNDRILSERLKQLRHQVASICQRLPRTEMLLSRDTTGDVGTTIATASEAERASLKEVVLAASARVQQALRTMEEYAKTVDTEAASGFENCRYQSYTILGAIERIVVREPKLEEDQLYALVSGRESNEHFAARLKKLADAGVDIVQLRDKNLTDRELYERARVGVETLRNLSTKFIVNDRVDIAASVVADGVHLGQSELPVSAARKIIGSAIIGVSTHNIEQVHEAIFSGADYIGCGPTFKSNTKCFEEFAGTKFLAQVAAETSLPAFAIGGINLANLHDVIEAGFRRVAVSAALSDEATLTNNAQLIREQLGAG